VAHPNDIAQEAIALAETWQDRANALMNSREKARHRRMAGLLANPLDKAFLVSLIDQSFRSRDKERVADQIHSLLVEYGIPKFFTPLETLLMYLFVHVGRFLPNITVPLIIRKLQQDSRHAIIPGEAKALCAHLHRRSAQKVSVNINYLGEAVLGEEEAGSRLQMYIKALEDPDSEHISVKISTIYSQIQPLAFEQTVSILKERLSRLYRVAADNLFNRTDGSAVPKFVNLGMESYRDQAISNVVYSAFGNSGQKCSATSLLILEKELYDDPGFKRQFVDAAQSVATGSAWDFSNRMGPLIHPPQGELKKALTQLHTGESWALKPQNLDDNPHLWSPGIKWDVQPQSRTHLTEFFGPLLGVMRARDLRHAIELVNQTGYGLTSGLESLDTREQQYWLERVKAGNLYVNRGTTGAVTLRQPFGGMGKSSLGAGIKAGSPKYAAQFMDCEEVELPSVGPIQQGALLMTLNPT
jgi:hypothetical protein